MNTNTADACTQLTARGEAVFSAQLLGDLTAPSKARAAIRQALSGLGLSSLAPDAELAGSELVANAAQHAVGTPIGLTIREDISAGGQRRIACEVSDASPVMPQARPVEADSERGRGLAIVTALAEASGVTATPGGKTAWFTFAVDDDPSRDRLAEFELEAGA